MASDSPPVPLTPSAEAGGPEYPALRNAARILGAGLLLFSILYYPFLTLATRTLIPFLALATIGSALGLAIPRARLRACLAAWWLVVLAVVLRRAALAHVPMGTQVFGGALFGYPSWAVWFAELLRLAVYFWALALGSRLAARLRLGKRT